MGIIVGRRSAFQLLIMLLRLQASVDRRGVPKILRL